MQFREQPGKRFATTFLMFWIWRAKASGGHMLLEMAQPEGAHCPRPGTETRGTATSARHLVAAETRSTWSVKSHSIWPNRLFSLPTRESFTSQTSFLADRLLRPRGIWL